MSRFEVKVGDGFLKSLSGNPDDVEKIIEHFAQLLGVPVDAQIFMSADRHGLAAGGHSRADRAVVIITAPMIIRRQICQKFLILVGVLRKPQPLGKKFFLVPATSDRAFVVVTYCQFRGRHDEGYDLGGW